MSRLNSIEPNRAKGEVREIYSELEAEMGKVVNFFKAMANSPAALRGYRSLSKLLESGELSDRDREVIYLTASQRNRCSYCLAAHSQAAHRAGFEEDEVLAIREGKPPEPRLEVLARFTRKLMETNGFVADSDVDELRQAGYDDGAIVEIPGMVALATFSNLFNHLNDTELDFPEAAAVQENAFSERV